LRREEIKLQVALITPLIIVKGWAAPETKAATERARLLIEQAEARGEPPEDPLLLFVVLFGFVSASLVAFDGDVSRNLAGQFLELAEKQRGSLPLSRGHSLVGISLMLRGNFTEAMAHDDQGLALYNPAEHRALGRVSPLADVEPSVTSAFFRSKTLWILGHPDAARANVDQALKRAREIDRAAVLLWALSGAFYIDIACGDYAAANARVDECIGLADEKDAEFWKAFAMLGRGWLLSLTG
jgi:tetratricopeptide (TPR) repeat protein